MQSLPMLTTMMQLSSAWGFPSRRRMSIMGIIWPRRLMQQIVVKPLPGYVNSFDIKSCGITGCSIMGDGSISIS